MLLGIFLASISLYIIYYFYNSIRALILAWNVAGPPTVPILGNALYYINKTSEGIDASSVLTNSQSKFPFIFLEILEISLGLLKKYGPFNKFWLGPQLFFGVQDPNDVEVGNSFCCCRRLAINKQKFNSTL